MLLEALIAFVIAALALVLVYRGGIEGLYATRLAERTQEAVSRARSRMDALCHGARLMPGMQSGDDGSGFSWHTKIDRAESLTLQHGSLEDPKPPTRADLFTVLVSISWPGRTRPHEVTLTTNCISIGPAAPP
jgi:general secretion pathway protein I